MAAYEMWRLMKMSNMQEQWQLNHLFKNGYMAK